MGARVYGRLVKSFRTVDEPAASRLEVWSMTIGELLLPLTGRAHPDDFEARLIVGDLGLVRVAQVTTSAGQCVRTPELIGDKNAALYQFDVIVGGEVMVDQDGRQAWLCAGDLAFVDPVRPASYTSTVSTHISVLFPRAMLPLADRDARAMTAVRVAGDRGSGAMVSAFARQLPRYMDDCHGVEAVRLGTSLVDLASMALSSSMQKPGALDPDARRRALLQHIYAFIDAHLGDPDLDPDSIAAAHHFSVRYLHKLFHTESTTVTAWIRERRLDRCRRDLLDPGRRSRSVAAIGAAWGMPNAAHFTRVFKSAYGCPPSAYRAPEERGNLMDPASVWVLPAAAQIGGHGARGSEDDVAEFR
jgi:AraC-like DNA-binding protein